MFYLPRNRSRRSPRTRRPEIEHLEERRLLAALALTPAGSAAGFGLTTFATGFPSDGNLGPIGTAFSVAGGVLASDAPGNVRLFPNTSDGQNAAQALVGQNYGADNALGLAVLGGNIYMTQFAGGQIVQLNPDGSLNQVIVNLPGAHGIVADPLTGHLLVSTVDPGTEIMDVDPVAKTATPFVTGHFEQVALSADGTTLYGTDHDTAHVEGFDTTTKAMTDYGMVDSALGLAVGSGTLAGNLFVSQNGAALVEVNLATQAQTVLATGGSAGTLLGVDPDGSLLVTQLDNLARLLPPSGGSFAGPNTSLALSANPATSAAGQAVTLTAAVTVLGANANTPGGTVDFVDETTATDLGSQPLSGTTANLSTTALSVATHTIQAVYRGDAHFTSSSATTTATVTMGTSLSGQVFNDTNGDGKTSAGKPPLQGWTVFLDQNRDGVLGTATQTAAAANVPLLVPGPSTARSALQLNGVVGAVLNVKVTLDLIETADLSVTLVGPRGTRVLLFSNVGRPQDEFTNTTFDDQALLTLTDASAPFAGSYRPQGRLAALNGLDPNGAWQLEVRNGAENATSTLKSWSLTVTDQEPSVQTGNDGRYSFANLPPGTAYQLDEVVQKGWVQTYAVDNDFGNFAEVSVSGTVFNDLNGDGNQESGEPGLAGRTVFVDYNNKGVPGSAVFQANATDTPRPIPRSQYQIITTSNLLVTGVPSGSAYLGFVDLNDIRVPDDSLFVYLTNPVGHSVELIGGETTGENLVGTTFADPTALDPSVLLVNSPAPYTGAFRPDDPLSTFNGDDLNGLWKLRVFAGATSAGDAINNWSLDIGFNDPAVQTDAAGHYVIPNLGPGTYRIRQVNPAGWVETAGAQDVTANSSDAFTVNFGSQLVNPLGTPTSAVLNTGTAEAVGTGYVAGDPGGPVSLTVYEGAPVTLTASFDEYPFVSQGVQWQVSSDGGTNYANIAGATATTLSFVATPSENGDRYRAVFASNTGAEPTNVAILTVYRLGTVYQADLNTGLDGQALPAQVNLTVFEGAPSVSLTATYTGVLETLPNTVQWQLSSDGGASYADIQGATASTLDVAPTLAENGYRYRAVFTINTPASGPIPAATVSVPTNAAMLAVFPLAEAYTAALNTGVDGQGLPGPVSLTVIEGSPAAVLTATYTGLLASDKKTVQWQLSTDGGSSYANIQGAFSSMLTVVPTPSENGYRYRAVFTVNSAGTPSVPTNAAILAVYPPPVITTNPVNLTINAGAAATFTAAATSVPDATVQWQVSSDGGVTFSNNPFDRSSTLTFIPSSSQSGYQYRAVFSNPAGSTTSSAAVLTVNPVTAPINAPPGAGSNTPVNNVGNAPKGAGGNTPVNNVGNAPKGAGGNTPVTNVPSKVTVAQNATLAFTGARRVSIGDTSAGSRSLHVLLTATHGALMLTPMKGMRITGNHSARLTLSGSLTLMNRTLATMRYRPAMNFGGMARIDMHTTDAGSKGSKPQSDANTISVTVKMPPR